MQLSQLQFIRNKIGHLLKWADFFAIFGKIALLSLTIFCHIEF
jgi:hypothetical protein